MYVQMPFEDKKLSVVRRIIDANKKSISELQSMVCTTCIYTFIRFTKWFPTRPSISSYHLMGIFLMHF